MAQGPVLPSPAVVAVLTGLSLGVGAVSVAARQAEDCGGRASLSVLVTDESGTMLLPGAIIVLRWTAAERMPVREAVDDAGRFHLCVPSDARGATLWVEFDDQSSQQTVVAFEPGMATEVELRTLSGPAGTGRIIGEIHNGVMGDPVVAAAVSLPGRGAVESNDRGRFVLSGAPDGEPELQVRHRGYAPLRHRVRVDRGLTTEMEIGIVAPAVEMSPLVATVTRLRRLELTGFYERKLWGELVGAGTGGLQPNDVAGVEVYEGLQGLPAESRDDRNRCGAVVTWTK